MAQALTPSMLEFMDGECVRLAREIGGADLPDAGALLMIEADGDQHGLAKAVRALREIAAGEGCIEISDAADAAQSESLWAARKALSPALRTLASGKINEDVVVPVSRIPDLLRHVAGIAAATELRIVCFGHAGNGNLHVNILFDKHDDGQRRRADAALAQVFATVIELGGQLSGEHGIGLAKRDFMAAALGAPALAAMRAIKRVFDPDGILNPGKVLPPTDVSDSP
jgi:D-lactate dehydrogenase